MSGEGPEGWRSLRSLPEYRPFVLRHFVPKSLSPLFSPLLFCFFQLPRYFHPLFFLLLSLFILMLSCFLYQFCICVLDTVFIFFRFLCLSLYFTSYIKLFLSSPALFILYSLSWRSFRNLFVPGDWIQAFGRLCSSTVDWRDGLWGPLEDCLPRLLTGGTGFWGTEGFWRLMYGCLECWEGEGVKEGPRSPKS